MGTNGSKDVSSSRSRKGIPHSSRLENNPPDQTDFGTVFPNGLYSTTPQDYDSRLLCQLILTRKLSPFYKGLSDAPEPVEAPLPLATETQAPDSGTDETVKIQSLNDTDRLKLEKSRLYNDAVECPICFLYYPPNINYSRCCDQPICTECFIQIHRPADDPTNPATCPFCLESNYGVTYIPPTWSHAPSTGIRHTTSGVSDALKPRRKSVDHSHSTVVLIDHIRPHWNISAPSRASRRSSLAIPHALQGVTRPSRSASSAASTGYNQHLASMRDMNMDLEDWMVMEAIRLSLVEQQQQEQHDTST